MGLVNAKQVGMGPDARMSVSVVSMAAAEMDQMEMEGVIVRAGTDRFVSLNVPVVFKPLAMMVKMEMDPVHVRKDGGELFVRMNATAKAKPSATTELLAMGHAGVLQGCLEKTVIGRALMDATLKAATWMANALGAEMDGMETSASRAQQGVPLGFPVVSVSMVLLATGCVLSVEEERRSSGVLIVLSVIA